MTESNLVAAVIDAVATADGVAPSEVETLYEHIDPEILAKLDEADQGDWSFTFQYSDHQVTVTSEEQILIDGVSHTPDMSVE